MKTLLSLFFLFLFSAFLCAQDAELKTYKEELVRALKLKNSDSIAAAYCHLGEYYAYRQADSARYYNERGLQFARTDVSEPSLLSGWPIVEKICLTLHWYITTRRWKCSRDMRRMTSGCIC